MCYSNPSLLGVHLGVYRINTPRGIKNIPPQSLEDTMGKAIAPLTLTKIKTAKPKEKDYKLFDGGGLFLLVTKRKTKLWRLKYKFLNFRT